MNDISKIEAFFQEFIHKVEEHLPDGLIDVNIEFLQELDLLHFDHGTLQQENDSFTRYFHVVESLEKITLVNEDFIIWILPENIEGRAVTYTYIARNTPKGPHVEMGYTTGGVYNSSGLVLHILEKLLVEIQENEALIHRYKKSA